jgi:predicted DNA-binding transcriptional regulator YafY
VSAADRLSRLLALVPWLIAHDGVTIAECADHFGVTPEQLEVDLWLLVVCGLPGYGPDQLVDIDFWDDGRIHVSPCA